MADETPNSFRDPYWVALADTTGQKLGLPDGLLSAIVTKGERSNNDAVSSAGAKTVFQITPSTRKLALDKFGVDAYLSPENAAEVAGKLLKDSLDRNGGDPKAAIGEYIGGTDRGNWGPVTKAYIGRVSAALPRAATSPQQAAGAPTAGGLPDGSPSTFDRVSAQQSAAAPTSAIANIFSAYQAGKMTAEQAQAFEGDVRAGKLMLPPGAALKQDAAAPTPDAALRNILAAYQGGKMTPEQQSAFEGDVRSGKLTLPAGVTITPALTEDPPGSMSGPAEAIAQVASGALLAPVAGLAGLGAMATNAVGLTDTEPGDVVRNVMGAQLQPQTASGKRIAGVVNYPLEKLAEGADYLGGATTDLTGSPALGAAVNTAVNVGAPALLGRVGGAIASPVADAAVRGIRTGVDKAASVLQTAGAAIPDAIRNVMPGRAAPTPTAGTMGSGGAAGVDIATQRRAAAADLPVPIDLTEGQATRTFEQQQFERETAKNATTGAPLRERFADQNAAMAQNIDAFIDQTGAEAPNLRATGVAVDDAVNKAAASDKNAIRVAYKEAEKAGELEQPVALDPVVQHLNDSAPEATTAPVLTTARALALKLGMATEDTGGVLLPQPVTLKIAEQFRQAINRATGAEPTNIRQSSIMKGLVDQSTEGAGGTLYRQARALRSRFAQNYENHAVIADILNTKKGLTDRAVALEDIHRRTILDGSLDDVRQVRRVLQRSGPAGHQAWRELLGQTLQFIKDQALGNAARDTRGNAILSAPKLDRIVRSLDADGKLDFIFGKRGAEKLRTVNDVAKTVYTSPPGSVNTSNTASILAGMLDLGMGSMTGLPLPVASGARYLIANLKDRKLAARVKDALGTKSAEPPPLVFRPHLSVVAPTTP